jgi:hypothetical protein
MGAARINCDRIWTFTETRRTSGLANGAKWPRKYSRLLLQQMGNLQRPNVALYQNMDIAKTYKGRM